MLVLNCLYYINIYDIYVDFITLNLLSSNNFIPKLSLTSPKITIPPTSQKHFKIHSPISQNILRFILPPPKNILRFILPPPSEKEIFTFEKINSDLSPKTSNPSHYRNTHLKHNTHPTAFEGIYFFKSNKFFLSAPPQKHQ